MNQTKIISNRKNLCLSLIPIFYSSKFHIVDIFFMKLFKTRVLQKQENHPSWTIFCETIFNGIVILYVNATIWVIPHIYN